MTFVAEDCTAVAAGDCIFVVTPVVSLTTATAGISLLLVGNCDENWEIAEIGDDGDTLILLSSIAYSRTLF